MGTVQVDTTEAFESAGINQTRHRIVFQISAQVRIVQPMLSTDITVKTDVPIAETIVIGNVPQAILNLR
jgi:sporulation protein YunB